MQQLSMTALSNSIGKHFHTLLPLYESLSLKNHTENKKT